MIPRRFLFSPVAVAKFRWALFSMLLADTCLLAPASYAATYYVDGNSPGASDANPGTQTLPWRTIQKAANTARAGDIAIVRPGAYDERVRLNSASGTPASPIAFTAETQRTVTMQGFVIVGANYVHISGFDISNAIQTTVEGGGIWIAANGVEVEDCHFRNIPRPAVQFKWQKPWPSDCAVRNCRVYRCQYGFVVHGQNLSIENNEIDRPVQHMAEDSDYCRFFGDNIAFRDNWLHGARAVDLPSAHVDGFQTFSENGWGARNCIIERNIVESFHEGLQISSLDGIEPDAAVSNITIQNNVFVGGELGGSWGIAAIDNVQDLKVYHNTFVHLTSNGVGIRQNSSGTVRNNIFRDIPVNYFASSDSSVVGGHNILFPASERDHFDATDLRNRDPLFVDYAGGDYKLSSASPARNAAIDVGVTDDIDRITRPQGAAPDIGAHEFAEGPPTLSIGPPSAAVTSAGPVSFAVTYGNATSVNLTAADVTLNQTGTATGIIAVSGSGPVLRVVTISSITGDGTIAITIAPGTATNSAGDPAPGIGPSVPFTVDSTPITVTINDPSTHITRSGPVTFGVVYDNVETVTLAPADIVLNRTGTATGSIAVTASKADSQFVRTILIDNVSGDGTLGISVIADTARDAAGFAAPGAGPSAPFIVDNLPPQITIGSPSPVITDVGPVSFQVTYSSATSVSLGTPDVFLDTTGTAAVGGIGVSGSGAVTRVITLSEISGDGRVGIHIAPGTAIDSVGNVALGSAPSANAHVIAALATLPLHALPAALALVVAYLLIGHRRLRHSSSPWQKSGDRKT